MKQVERAISAARALQATEFALFLRWTQDRTLAEIVSVLRASPISARLYSDRRIREILRMKPNRQLDRHFSVEVQSQPLDLFERAIKRAFDIIVAASAIVCLAPLFAVVAVLIKSEGKGPVFFKQTRRGFNNRQFRIWKFRTMTAMEDGRDVVQARRNDRRVTAVGRVLRRTSVDELPQLFNVLVGDMSIVGPRPHPVVLDEEFGAIIRDYAFRRHVKPGLTGAAQVKGLRGQTETVSQMEARVRADLWYVNNWTLWLDLKIVFQTFGALIAHEAY